jgi:FixJ family two-component response regulator
MARFNPDFWEIPIDNTTMERVAENQGIWFETVEDRDRRHAMREFFQQVSPVVEQLIDGQLTERQREVLKLYYFYGKTQEDIAVILNLTQSTVSRHLYGTMRGGKKVGGAIPKLRKAIDKSPSPLIQTALETLQERMSTAA